MAANVSLSNDQVIILRAAWPLYASLLNATVDQPLPRLAFDGASIELMSPSSKHEVYNRLLEALVRAVAAAWDLELSAFGSTTLKKEPRGAEPDSSFYLGHQAELMLGIDELDLRIHPAPDIVVEIDMSQARIDKQSIYASLGIAEFWRYDGSHLRAFFLRGNAYVQIENSEVIPGLAIDDLDRFLEMRNDRTQSAILREWDQWLRARER